MGKAKRGRSLADNEAKAVARNLRISPQKLNLVAATIRGKKVDKAIAELEFSRKRIAGDVRKCVMSAVANAENNHDLDRDTLVVAVAAADEGPTLKRIRPRAQGRAYRVRKRTSHITVEVESVPRTAARRAGGRRSQQGRAR